MRLSAQERFDVRLEDSWIIELDSSTPAKFSRHLVIRVPGAAFQSNFHVGAFVRDLCEAPGDAAGAEGAASRQPRQELLVNKVRLIFERWTTPEIYRVISLWNLLQACDPQVW